MSVVTVQEVKRWVRQFHNFDDQLIQMLIDGATDELLQYMDRTYLPRAGEPCPDPCESEGDYEPVSDSDAIAPSVKIGICCLVQALYEGNDAAEKAKLREIGYDAVKFYRCRMGV